MLVTSHRPGKPFPLSLFPCPHLIVLCLLGCFELLGLSELVRGLSNSDHSTKGRARVATFEIHVKQTVSVGGMGKERRNLPMPRARLGRVATHCNHREGPTGCRANLIRSTSPPRGVDQEGRVLLAPRVRL